MNRLLCLLILLSATSAPELFADSFADAGTFSEFTALPDFNGIPERVQNALKDAQKALAEYAHNSSPENQKAILTYLPYYKSWGGYQAVTPAPYAVTDAINASAASIAYIKALTDIAQQFKLPPTGRMGGSRLSDDGVTFYDYVISMTKEKLNSNSRKSSIIIPKLETRLR